MADVNKNKIKTEYIPIGSSYNTNVQHLNLDSVDVQPMIYLTSGSYSLTLASHYNDNFKVYIRNNSAGEIFNAYEKMIFNSQWDCRDNGDYQTILLGREYMFYNIDGKAVSYTTENNDKIINEITFKLTYKDPISFFPFINKEMVSENITNVFDQGTTLKIKTDSKIDTNNNLEKMLNRDKCRKFSENHFAISGFNLVGHSISINSQVCNTVSEVYDEDEKNTISVLGDLYEDKYIVEATVTPEFPASSMTVGGKDYEHRSDEYLANKLLEELRYCYQGNIIIKFNPDIEIGDTITLMDNVSSTYGVFQVDSYEHSLDQRGLVTSMTVRASWTPKDPFLDYHSQAIGYTLIDELKRSFNLSDVNNDTNDQIHKIMSLYLKYIVQSPRYCVFYKKKKKGFFNPSTIEYNNIKSPTALPLRFFVMYIKGQQTIPKSLEPAFIAVNTTNGITSIISNIGASLADMTNHFIKGLTKATIKTLFFISDMLISTVTFNMSELIKPLFGLTANKALDNVYDEVKKIDDDDAKNMLQYNPYEKKYKLMYNNYDLVIGFFNVRLQREDDLYANNKTLEKNTSNNMQFLSRKVSTVKKMLNDVFDVLFLVEVYDNFSTNIGNSHNYTYKDFLDDCSSEYTSLDFNSSIYSNNYGNEYGVVFKNNDVSNNISYKTIPLSESGRYAIETTVDISNLNILEYESNVAIKKETSSHIEYELVYIQKKYLEQLKIIFFHNLYGDNQFDKGENSLETRRANIRNLLSKYEKYCDSKTTGVIIMADFNLNVYNKGELPYKDNKNYVYELPNDKFIAKIKSPTTLNQYGYLKGNQYDNILLSRNINKVITAKVFEYPEKDKLTISDHIPVYIGIKKEQD